MAEPKHNDPDAIHRSQAELEGEHKSLRELVAVLSSTRDARALAPLLDELHNRLFEHFRHEEFPGGLYDRLGVVSQRFRDLVRDLVDEHFRILGTVRGLAQRARDTASEAQDDVAREAKSLAGLLRKHEEREHELAESAKRAH